jgi:DNA primase
MTAIEEIKARIDIVDLVSESVQLRHSGKNYTGFCPFHANTRTPAFAVFPESGTWRCFGQCNEGGDIFKFIMKKENWEFPEALRYLAEKAGVELKPLTPEQQIIAEEHDNLRELLEEAVTFYRHQLLNTPAGKQALEYLHKRNLSDETIETFGLGYAPDSWDATNEYFKSRNFSQQDLIDCGQASERDDGGIFDRFRNRIMFPIRDGRGRMTGFGARILDPNDAPKFLNSPQTVLFDKGGLLYGLDRARKAIRAQDQAVIVEGYLDVIAVYQAGYENTVSPMGTALTDHQLALLKRFSRRIILALDPDVAGFQATLRGLEVARQTLDRSPDPVFDARGLLGYEARLKADIRVTTLPEGLDPDEIVNRDASEWEKILKNAKPIVIHVMDTLTSSRDLDDPKVKDEIAMQVLPLINDVPSPIERNDYLQRLARKLHVDERALLDEAASFRPRRRSGYHKPLKSRTPKLIEKQAIHNNYAREAYSLGVLLRRPELLFQVDRKLQEYGLTRLSPADFQHADHQAILRLIQESVDQDATEPLRYVLDKLSLPLMELADELLERTADFDPNQERVAEETKRILLDLRRQAVRQSIDYHHFLIEEAQQEEDTPKVVQYNQLMVQLISTRLKLDKALG